MTRTVPATPLPRAARGGILAEIAARRAHDVAAELGDATYAALARAAGSAPAPRPIAERLAAPGLHLIAEVKRSSPSAGAIAPAVDVVVRARAYAAGGAAAISVLCEPHWFGGSVADLRAVRAAVAVPVLAKEFVVDPRQLPVLRAAGADVVLLLAVLHPARRLAALVRRAFDLGLEPLVEIHAERELDAALASGARLVGVNSRDLRSLVVDPDRPIRLRELVPADRIAIAESGVRDAGTLRRWRAAGYDAALVGEALMRAADPRAAAAALVHAGAVPDDPGATARAPFVKICGVVDAAGLQAALAAGADAIGLNFVAGTPRAISLAEGADLARHARAASPTFRAPLVVAITVNADERLLAAIVRDVDPDAIQYAGGEPREQIAASPRPAWVVVHLPAAGAVDGVTPGDPGWPGRPATRGVAGERAVSRDIVRADALVRARAYLAAGAERILLDTAGGPHPGGTGTPADAALAAAVAGEIPVVLAGGLNPASVGAALLRVPAVGVDVASGVERPRPAGARPTKDPLAVALFAKRARAARFDRPHAAARPEPVDPGLLAADEAGRWGVDRTFGGRYVPETLVTALRELEEAYSALRGDPVFWAELRTLLATYAGRPTSLYRADRLAADVLGRARELDPAADLPASLRIYLKREDLAHTGAHKINNALGQALLTRRLGKTRVIAETGAGQHGVATATACALLGLPCVVFMGAVDIDRQRPNVLRMEALGAEVRPVTSGTATLKDAVNDAMRDWVTNVATTHYVLGSAMGPHPYPTLVRDLQRVIGDEAAAQLQAAEGRLPDLLAACVGGGSNAIGLFSRFIGEPAVRLVAAEAGGEGIATGRHAAALAGGTPGILHGARSYMLQDRDGQVTEAHSISAGLDYPGVGPQLSALYEAGRLEVVSTTDDDAVAAIRDLSRAEGILPALEPAHALAALPRILLGRTRGPGGPRTSAPLPDDAVILVGLSGRGDKDLAALERREATAQ
jgi:tryptophan synthase beta chain